MTQTQGTNWKNVNNWHWVDKNCMNWTKDYLKKSFQVESTSQKLHLSLDTVSGDCDLNQRKGQVINIYDIAVKGSWKVLDADLKETHKGTVEIPEFMHDTTMEELVINIDTDSNAKDSQDIKNLIRKEFTPKIKEHFSHFSADLMAEHAKDVFITNDQMNGHPVKSNYNPKPVEALAPKSAETATSGAKSSQKGAMVTINQTISFQCAASDLFDVLLSSKKVVLWSRAPCTLEKTVGSPISLFGGNITGSLLEWVDNEKIVMTWRLKSWPVGHESKVTITLQQGSDSTTLKLVQENVPIGEKSVTEQNWKNYYWNSIKRVFGFGALL